MDGKYVSLLTDAFTMALKSGCQCGWTAPLLIFPQFCELTRLLFSPHFPYIFPHYPSYIALSPCHLPHSYSLPWIWTRKGLAFAGTRPTKKLKEPLADPSSDRTPTRRPSQ